MLHERFRRNIGKFAQVFEVMIEKLLAQLRRQIGFGVIEKGSDVVLQRPAASALIVEEEGFAAA